MNPPEPKPDLSSALARTPVFQTFLERLGGSDPGHGSLASTEPFLTVVTRTQGRRPVTLNDVLLCLAAQSFQSFELVLVCHKTSDESQAEIERLVDSYPAALREKVRIVRLDHGNRTAPLNYGFSLARGEYVAILDDDDIVFDHWIETFHRMAQAAPGKVLRTVAIQQDFIEAQGPTTDKAPRSIHAFDLSFANDFDLIDHLTRNESPPVCLAFPRTAFHELGITFDETLTTTEDWDFLLRTALVVGVHSDPEITSIYRLWKQGESSQTVHSQEEWKANYQRICEKIDSWPIVLPPGTSRRLRDCYQVGSHRVNAEEVRDGARVRQTLTSLLDSSSWKLSRPVRQLARLMGKPAVAYNLEAMSYEEMVAAVKAIQGSTSWRLTAPVRKVFSALRGD